jgi:hypothetical protein
MKSVILLLHIAFVVNNPLVLETSASIYIYLLLAFWFAKKALFYLKTDLIGCKSIGGE